MKKIFYLLAILLLASIFPACKKESKLQTVSLNGRWNMQQERVVTYLNNLMQKDTTYVVSAKSTASVLFNIDLSYTCNAQLVEQQAVSSVNGSAGVGEANVSGTYSLNSSALNLSNGLVGFSDNVGHSAPQGPQGLSPLLTLNTSEITLLTLSKLNIHTETGYTTTVNDVASNVKTETFYYYSK